MYFSLVSTSWTVARVHGRARSVARPSELSCWAIAASVMPVMDEELVDPAHQVLLRLGPRDQHDTVCLQALVLAPGELALGITPVRPPEAGEGPIPAGPALPEAELDQPTLAGEHLGREFRGCIPRPSPA